MNYDESNWRLLQQQLETNLTTIPLLNRVQLLSDAFALAKAGNLNYTIPLGLTKYLVDEKSYLPWEAAFRGLGDMDFVISNSRFNHLYLVSSLVPMPNGKYDLIGVRRITWAILLSRLTWG